MSDLIVIGFEDEAAGRRAYDEVQELNRQFIVQLTGLAIITVDKDGKSHVDTPGRMVGASAAGGALWGMLFGLLFLTPAIGALLGGALGALFGRLNKSGVNNAFREQVQSMLRPGTTAVVIMATKVTEDKFAAAMQPFGGQLVHTSLSDQDERDLAGQLAGTATMTQSS
jgi:uncharacterized membrane protein